MRVQFGEFVFDGDARELRRLDAPLHLTPKAFELLQVLIEERPRAIRKEELRERLWPDVVVEEANLKNLVAEIRGVLPPQSIRTVHRFGYAFVADADASRARLVAPDRIHHLQPGDNLIGRDADCAVILEFTGVSRHHAKIRVAADRFVLEDLGSKNGTVKNGQRVTGCVDLQDGDRIFLGGVSLIFRATPRAESTATING